jgi:hypothetical protein
MSKHTPGTWFTWTDQNGCLQVGPSTNYTVAQMWSTPLEGQEANARLIAAAPDLLASLQVMLRDYAAVHDIGDVEMQPAIYQARAAIAKATRETK